MSLTRVIDVARRSGDTGLVSSISSHHETSLAPARCLACVRCLHVGPPLEEPHRGVAATAIQLAWARADHGRSRNRQLACSSLSSSRHKHQHVRRAGRTDDGRTLSSNQESHVSRDVYLPFRSRVCIGLDFRTCRASCVLRTRAILVHTQRRRGDDIEVRGQVHRVPAIGSALAVVALLWCRDWLRRWEAGPGCSCQPAK